MSSLRNCLKRLHDHSKECFRLLLLGAIGVVYGNIGTSPIYAFREALYVGAGKHAVVHEDILALYRCCSGR